MNACHFGGACPPLDARLRELPGLANLFRHRYCQGDFTQCARHRLAELAGARDVPDRLMPNDHESAAQLVTGYRYPA